MSWKAWYAVYGFDHRQVAMGPYSTRKAAERTAAQGFSQLSNGSGVRVVYELPDGVALIQTMEDIADLLCVERGRTEAAVRTIAEMAYERWPAGGRN